MILRGDAVKNIGVVVKSEWTRSFLKRFFKRHRFKIEPVSEYDFNFVVVNDDCNYTRIFNKHKVLGVVVLTDNFQNKGFRIIDGDSVYKRMLPEFVRKSVKSNGTYPTVAVVDKTLSDECWSLTDKLCSFCNSVVVVTENTEKAEQLCENLLENYGVVAEFSKIGSDISCDLAVVLEDYEGVSIKNCKKIDKNAKKCEKIIDDFYIPFKIKPPYGIKNLVFAECIDIINTKSIDIN